MTAERSMARFDHRDDVAGTDLAVLDAPLEAGGHTVREKDVLGVVTPSEIVLREFSARGTRTYSTRVPSIM